MESTAEPPADAEENMRLAVERFRTKMEASNRQFLQDRMDEIEAMNLSTEEEKLLEMRTYWPGLKARNDIRWMATQPPEVVRQLHEEANVDRLSDVKSLYHRHMDGVEPPNGWTDEWRQMYLNTVQTVCNEVAFRSEEDNDFEVPPCYDLALFLKYASGVQDPDFRYAGMASFDPPGSLVKETFDISKDREDLIRHIHRYYLCEESWFQAYAHQDLEVRAGFQTGNGIKDKQSGHDEWYSMYLYCRRDPEDSDQSHKDWAWRVVISEVGTYRDHIEVYGKNPIFDSIVEFLDWYSSWLEHLDMDQVRKDVALNHGDWD
ncbi:uncharacterized protein N7503_006965 [Penicillium pulvis]|uniref:uncharacterized protein n=1 Tax=Penicillium pulvis TaxID=1562058 RepID=UPI00254676C3|nr:uncharacterized protein N7503_006965 [Penicillium pulvis]KAJ5797669.1 hypothetical protein N7503_006965 [Penicillium pulvis]